jgi:hypothetical protein
VRSCIGKFRDRLIMACYESAVFLPDDEAREVKTEVAKRMGV